MIYTIKNEKFEASINSYGAQLLHLQSLATCRQYLWCADESVWGKTSPVLFPQIGRVRDSYIKVGETVYNMTKHGFARNSEFAVEKKSESEIVFLMRDNDYTRTIYPYAFEFRVIFSLCGSTLKTIYEVKNTGTSEMYFALGGHTGYSTEIGGAKLSDYKLVFDQPEHLVSEKVDLVRGLLSGEQEDFGERTEIALSAELFEKRDTLVFKNIVNKSVKLVGGGAEIRVDYPDFPNLAIWAMEGTERFVCIEPWIGHTDTVATKHTLAKKESFARLDKGKTLTAEYDITVTE